MIHTADTLLHHEMHEPPNPSPVYSSMTPGVGMLSNRPRASTLAGASLLGAGNLPGSGQVGLGGLNRMSASVARSRAGTMAGLSKHPDMDRWIMPVLEEVSGNLLHGVTVLDKIMRSQFVPSDQKDMMSEQIKEVMLSLRVHRIPAYKRSAIVISLSVR
ncbi:hypothetical protein DFH28DRAFT_1228765 [Melampsora americana]|nr:hypothetical protein DFH28DRAFT_1228765 [Melampsora americana]